jgi:paraquat-inducible protein B
MVVDLVFDPKAPKAAIVWEGLYAQLPTAPGSLQELTTTVVNLLERFDSFPLTEIGGEIRTVLNGLNITLDLARRKIEELPTDQIGSDLQAAVREISTTLADAQTLMEKLDGEVVDEAVKTMAQLRRSLDSIETSVGRESMLNHEARKAASELADAARAMRILADYLSRHPEALLYGKDPETN